jgi:hypothetical protein
MVLRVNSLRCLVGYRGQADMSQQAKPAISVADDAVDGAHSTASMCQRWLR